MMYFAFSDSDLFPGNIFDYNYFWEHKEKAYAVNNLNLTGDGSKFRVYR